MTPQLWAKPKYTKCPKCGTESMLSTMVVCALRVGRK